MKNYLLELSMYINGCVSGVDSVEYKARNDNDAIKKAYKMAAKIEKLTKKDAKKNNYEAWDLWADPESITSDNYTIYL